MANGYQSIMARLLGGSRQDPYTERVNMRPSWDGGKSFKPWEHGFDDRNYQRASPGPEAGPTQYMAEAMTKPGWDRDWDKYQKTLGDYVSGQRKGVNDDIPQGDWQKIANWYEKSGMPGYDTWKKDQPVRREFPNPSGESLGWGPTVNYNPGPGMQPWGGSTRREIGSPQNRYYEEATQKPGWNSGWDKYASKIKRFLWSGEDPTGDLGGSKGIPKDAWQDIQQWYSKSGMTGYDDWKKDNPSYLDSNSGKYYDTPKDQWRPEGPGMQPWGGGTSFSPWEQGIDDREWHPALPSELTYISQASKLPGWNKNWNKYVTTLGDYIGGKRSSVTEGQGAIPQKDWQEIANWYEKSGMPGFDDWKKQQKPTQQNSLIQLLTMLQNQGQQRQPKTINDRLLGPDRAAMEKYNQEQGMLQNMARRNSLKRQALSNILNMSQRNASQYGYMPSGGSSGGTLMDLFSQQQNQSLQNQFEQLGPNPQDEYAMWLQQQQGLDRPY